MTASEFHGRRLRLARAFHGLTQGALAERVAIAYPYLSQLEAGKRSPSDDVLNALAHELQFEPAFFFQPLRDEFTEEECHFRRRATTTLTVRSRVLARGTLFGELVSLLEDVVNFPRYSVPTIKASAPADIERAAERCRMKWGLGVDTPIDNMVRVAEQAGVVITKVETGSLKVDAFARHGSRGIIVLTSDKESPARARLDTAHELGHLVMHEGVDPGLPETEAQAYRFAGAFLMPRAGFVREFPRGSGAIPWPRLFALKERWRVSLPALVRRGFELGLLDPSQYQRAYKYIHFKGWHAPGAEPVIIPDEDPEAIESAFNEGGQDRQEVARRLFWSPAIFTAVSGVQMPNVELPASRNDVVSLHKYRNRKVKKDD